MGAKVAKGREILGLLLKRDSLSGQVVDLFADKKIQKIQGLVIAEGGEEEIISWLPLILENGQLQVQGKAVEGAVLEEGYRLKRDLIGQEINLADGRSGYLGDVLVELPEGKIKGVEVSRGLVGDLLDGRFLYEGEFFLPARNEETK